MTFMSAAVLAVVGEARSEKTLVDRVVAVVEDDAIFQSDVDQTIKQFLLQRGQGDLSGVDRSQLERDALQELINSRLILAKAARLGIDVSFSEVESMVEKAIAENVKTLGGQQAFDRQLASEGLSRDGLKRLYREQIRNRMMVERVLSREIDRSSLQITEEDLRAAYETRKDQLPMRPAVVHLRTIYVALESSDNAQAVARQRIDDIRSRIEAGEDFGGLAREYSEDPSAEIGGSLGAVTLDDLSDRTFAEAAAALSVGEVSEPVQTGYGYHLIQVTAADSERNEVELRHILIRINPGEQDIQTVFNEAKDLHRQLVAGAPFDSMAVRHSDDPATASSGGDLGWLRVNDLPQFFQDVLVEMKVGDISPVLREPTGFRIVKLLGREDSRPYEFDEVLDELRRIVEQEKMASTYDAYVMSLRDEFYVDVRATN